jgi:hypothetical protein
VKVEDGGTFTLSGGKITDNKYVGASGGEVVGGV